MQTANIELRAQQIVMAFLGFYRGPIDGIWSSDTIAAKRKFECDDAFIPAAPSGGLPFAARQKLPKGCLWDSNGLMTHRDLTPEKAAEIMARQQKKKATLSEPSAAQAEVTKQEPVQTEKVQQAQPQQNQQRQQQQAQQRVKQNDAKG